MYVGVCGVCVGVCVCVGVRARFVRIIHYLLRYEHMSSVLPENYDRRANYNDLHLF